MDSSTALNVLAVCVSLFSLLVSGFLVKRQNKMMRHANELPILVSWSQEYRSREFQQAQNYVLQTVKKDYPANPGLAVSNLPEDVRAKVSTVISFYISLGAYLVFGLADESIIVSIFGHRADQSWTALEYLISGERKLRRGEQHEYASFFEDLVCRNRRREDNIKLLRLPARQSEPGSDSSDLIERKDESDGVA